MLNNILNPEELQWLRQQIDGAKKIVLTCHVSPDGDAIGACTAMANYLKRKGKQAYIITPTTHPDFLSWLPGAADVRAFEKNEAELTPIVQSADLFFCLDFNAVGRMETLAAPLTANPAPKVMIDHHLHPEAFCQLTVSHDEMSSTCELLFHILTQLDGLDSLTFDEATCLYTGMMTDTGGFTYNSNRSDIYFIISELLTKGIDKDQIYRNVYNNYSANRFRLLGYMLNEKMAVYPDYNAVLMTMTRDEQRRYWHKKGDTEGFVNIPLQIKDIRLSIFLRENAEKETIRVSLRSIGKFPCNKMAAEFFNGGGHLNASGGELTCPMNEAVEIVKAALTKYQPLLTEKTI